MELIWTLRAQKDLIEIGEYIAKDKSASARKWVEKLRDHARVAKEMPMAGRMVPEIGRDDIREVFVKSYRIVYLIKTNSIEILTVFEGHRLFPQSVQNSSLNAKD
jgi:toxin ParE1/3/4